MNVETGLGTFATRPVISGGKDGKRPTKYAAWMTEEIPFGWARFDIEDTVGGGVARTVFTARAARKGKGEKGEVDESRSPAPTPRPRPGTAGQ